MVRRRRLLTEVQVAELCEIAYADGLKDAVRGISLEQSDSAGKIANLIAMRATAYRPEQAARIGAAYARGFNSVVDNTPNALHRNPFHNQN